MTIEEKLDFILEYIESHIIDDVETITKGHVGMIIDAFKKKNVELDDREIHRLLLQVEKDELVGHVNFTSGAQRYDLSVKGILFLNNGGYVTQLKRQQIKDRRQLITDYGIIFAGFGSVLTALLLLSDKMSAFYQFFLDCLCGCH